MFRCILILTVLVPVYSQTPPPKKPPVIEEEAPPEEDATAKAKEYSFNPLQAETEMHVGNFNFKRGKYHAAAVRYLEATRWNPALAEAYLRMGEADEKQHDYKAAKEAYNKYLELAPDAKEAREVKKKLAKL